MQMSASLVTPPDLTKTVTNLNRSKNSHCSIIYNSETLEIGKFPTIVEYYIKYGSCNNEIPMHPLFIHSATMYGASTICCAHFYVLGKQQ